MEGPFTVYTRFQEEENLIQDKDDHNKEKPVQDTGRDDQNEEKSEQDKDYQNEEKPVQEKCDKTKEDDYQNVEKPVQGKGYIGDTKGESTPDDFKPVILESSTVQQTPHGTDLKLTLFISMITILISILLSKIYIDIQLKEFNGILKKLNKEVPLLVVDVTGIKDDFGPLQSQFSEVQTNMTIIEGKMLDVDSLLQNSLKIQTELHAERENLEHLKVSVKNLSIWEKQLKETFDTQRTFVSKLGNDLDSITIKHTDLDKKINNSFSSTEKVTERLVTTETKLSSMADTIDKYKNKYETVEKVIDKVEKLHKKLEDLTFKTKQTEDLGEKTNTTITKLHVVIGNAESNLSVITNRTDEMKHKQKILNRDLISSQQNITSLETEVNNFKSYIVSRVKNITTEVDKQTSDMSSKLAHLNGEITEARKHNIDCVQKLSSIRETVSTLEEAMKDVKSVTEYTSEKLPNVDSRLRTLEEQISTPGQFWINVCLSTVLCILSMWILFPYHFLGSTALRLGHKPTSPRSGDTEHTYSRNQNQERIHDKIQSPVKLENKICVLSFYSQTQGRHLSLVKSALETSVRGNGIDIIPFYLKDHDDVFNIPRCKYIFVFVDYNARNVILENEDQDLGDKKVVTVKAALKIEAKVFVIYVKDQGSKNLISGHLYNPELTQFTTHPVLKDLESKKRCFSVYEHFNTEQKEQIGRMIV